MKNKKSLVPSLRFPEFREAGEWVEKTLQEVSNFINQKISSKEILLLDYVSTENILPDYDGITTASKLPPSGNVTYFIKNDILISNIRPYLKKIWFANKNGGASNDVIVVRAKTDISNKFLSFLLKNDEFINYVMKGAKGVKMPRGDISLIKEYPLAIPTLPEQQKIAACLSSLDELITAHSQKLDALKKHKKGLMQQLFPAEGQTVPSLRFPEFREAGEWVGKSLGELGEFRGGGTPSKDNELYWNGEIPWVSSSDIHEDSIHQISITRFITEDAIKNSATKFIPENSILLVSRVGVGKLAISKIKICTSQDFTNFTPKKENAEFLAYYLKTKKHIFISFNQGTSIKGFTKDDLLDLTIFLPSLPEQQKIAACLSSLDELITAQSQKLDALKKHKKGLMQRLFPVAIDE